MLFSKRSVINKRCHQHISRLKKTKLISHKYISHKLITIHPTSQTPAPNP